MVTGVEKEFPEIFILQEKKCSIIFPNIFLFFYKKYRYLNLVLTHFSRLLGSVVDLAEYCIKGFLVVDTQSFISWQQPCLQLS